MAELIEKSTATPQTILRRDYKAPDFLIEHVDLTFDLAPKATKVHSRLELKRTGAADAPLKLDGQSLKLLSLRIDGRELAADRYRLFDEHLTIAVVPDQFVLEVVVEVDPAANTVLEGLYQSNGLYCTQCEAEGFRRITYFFDRPDAMTRFTVRIEGDKSDCPVLLSNGNLIEAGELEGGRHYAVWDDPFPKPSYLFGLVAGHLGHIEDHFKTASGRDVTLRIYAAERDLDKCHHGMKSLKHSMRWDEEVYGLEYDLDIFNIVAISDFNMGAMENKSLNIFNTKCVLAKPETATDADFAAVESIVAHEYFHNWTGNRVTCRDWFQLSLKEGLTVFRDQQFSADMGSWAVKRIEDVRMLRAHQFPEDAGPLAHNVRPDSYIEINNFYTATVYEKGAEITRMMHSLVGAAGFRKGMDLYFARHDGQAVTCDDFVAAMEDATGVDLGQFRLWYSQAGTPVVEVSCLHDPVTKTLDMTVRQSVPATPGQSNKKPMHIPFAVALIGQDGKPLPLTTAGNSGRSSDEDGTLMLELREQVETFRFENIDERPVPSLLRGFSAPVRVLMEVSRDDLRFLMSYDNDPFNRWEASQRLATLTLQDLVARIKSGASLSLETADIEAFRSILSDESADKAWVAEALTLPSEGDLAGEMRVIDTDAIHKARNFMRAELATVLRPDFFDLYKSNETEGAYEFTAAAVGKRQLKNVALGYLMAAPDQASLELALGQLNAANNMTDELAAIRAIVHAARPEDVELRKNVLQSFYDKWRHEVLVIDKWFTIQATSPSDDIFDVLESLLRHSDFTFRNPNRVRSVVSAFSQMNPSRFHDSSGRGYRFLGEQIAVLDKINPQIAARLLQPLGRWQKHDPLRQELMRNELRQLLSKDLSRDVYEVASKSLG